MQKNSLYEFCRYLTPFFVFSFFSAIEYIVSEEHKLLFYGFKVILTLTVFLFLFRGYFYEIQGKIDFISFFVGLIVLGFWLLKNNFSVVSSSTSSMFFNLGFVKSLIYFFGTVIVVPIVEEVFFRSFLMRFLIKSDFFSIDLGTYTHFSFFLSAFIFAFLHDSNDWGVAFIAGVIYAVYLVKSKNLKGVIFAHSITNLGLFISTIVERRMF